MSSHAYYCSLFGVSRPSVAPCLLSATGGYPQYKLLWRRLSVPEAVNRSQMPSDWKHGAMRERLSGLCKNTAKRQTPPLDLVGPVLLMESHVWPHHAGLGASAALTLAQSGVISAGFALPRDADLRSTVPRLAGHLVGLAEELGTPRTPVRPVAAGRAAGILGLGTARSICPRRGAPPRVGGVDLRTPRTAW